MRSEGRVTEDAPVYFASTYVVESMIGCSSSRLSSQLELSLRVCGSSQRKAEAELTVEGKHVENAFSATELSCSYRFLIKI